MGAFTVSNFDPRKHLITLKGKTDYLPVSARLVWFRMERPDWSVVTTPVKIDMECNFAIFAAEIRDTEGRVIATGHKMETLKDFGDFIEKSETGAIGRALALCGFGTQFAPDFDEKHRIVDTPQPVREPSPKMPTVDPALTDARTKFAARAHDLGYAVTDSTGRFSKSLFFAVYKELMGCDPETAIADDWTYTATVMEPPTPVKPAPNEPHGDALPFDDPYADEPGTIPNDPHSAAGRL